ncbi:MFS transporter, partial [Salmonella enterica subsp. enterica serovar Typhimurium]|nr:MFS transporter [Salmonella enterica subsp. enterica serovar Typhimurium]
ATILIAVQAPRERAAWALGIVSSGVMAGNLIGPLAGGWLPGLIGIRTTFFFAGALIFLSFIMTLTLIREEVHKPADTVAKTGVSWSLLPARTVIICMLCTGLLLMLANMSIEPIITVYVRTLVSDASQITKVAGYVMAAAALGSIISASWLGKLADRIGHLRIITLALTAAGLLLIPQAFVTSGWQLVALRFLMGLALGGLLPCIAAVIRHRVPEGMVGSILGYSVAAQFAGQFIGPLMGGFVGGHIGMRAVFLATSCILLAGAAWNFKIHRQSATR